MTLDHIDELAAEIERTLQDDRRDRTYGLNVPRDESRKLAIAYIVGRWLESKQ